MASKNNLIKPPVVLAVVCACCCGLLAVANSVTKDKIAAAEAASIQESLQQLPNAGNFTEVSDFQPANNEKATATAVYVDENQQTAVLVTAITKAVYRLSLDWMQNALSQGSPLYLSPKHRDLEQKFRAIRNC